MSEQQNPKISVCIATYNMKQFLGMAIISILKQSFTDFEIVVYDDVSTDGTDKIPWLNDIPQLRYIRGETNLGVGNAFNAAISLAKGEVVILFCADDILCDAHYLSDVAGAFSNPIVGHVTRYYYQFIDKEYSVPVRAWRGDSRTLSNNPSGLAFRKKALEGCACSNRMFIETTHLVNQVLKKGWKSYLLNYDAVAVRAWGSTSTRPGYFLKRRVSSPVMDWHECGGDMTKDYVSLIQIRVGGNYACLFEEIRNFIKLRPSNAINPKFWFWAILTVVTPRWILVRLPRLYRRYIGKWLTKRITRSSILGVGIKS